MGIAMSTMIIETTNDRLVPILFLLNLTALQPRRLHDRTERRSAASACSGGEALYADNYRPGRNASTARLKASRASRFTRCPARGIVSSLAPAIPPTSRLATSLMCGRSCSPTMISAGHLISDSRLMAGGVNCRTGFVRYDQSRVLLTTSPVTVGE